jgi:hypothetical protein
MVVIAAGAKEGLHAGQRLRVVRSGMRISPRENLVLELPGDDVARLEVLAPFRTGSGYEGTLCVVVSGDSIALSDQVQREEGQ